MTELEKSCYPFAVLFFWIFLGSEVLTVNGSTDSQSNIRYFLYQSAEYPRDCQEAVSKCSSNNAKSGVYLIKPDQYPEPFEVYCDNNGTSTGWTVIKRRFDGSIGYTRNWNDFKYGFGFLGSEFWMGNEKLAHLTNQKRYKLLIYMENAEGQSYEATYDDFRITDEWGNYSLYSVGIYNEIAEFNITWCVTNKQFKNGSICERSCENPNVCIQSNPSEMERCVCQGNYMIHEGSCIPMDQCGCYVSSKNAVLMENEYFINSACSYRITCINNRLINETYICSNDATCEESNGSGICTCNQWFVGDGANCTRHPCYDDGKARVLSNGESYINSVCSSRITCSNNRLTRTVYRCHQHATCEERNGVGICTCNQWYEGNGVECIRHPCYDEGKARVLSNGETYINSDCSSRITCSNNRLTRTSYRCHQHATCEETNGVGECNCDEWFEGDGVDRCERIGPRDCSHLHREGRRRNGVYTIYPRGSSGFNVYCEMSDSGWTVVQKRTGSLSFYRNWNDYKTGFGSPGGDHWLGNDKIYKLTSQDTYQLRIEKTDSAGASYHASYSRFSISNEGQKYRLSLGTYSGNAGYNAMGASSGYRFSTHDQDNDGSRTYDCAEKHRGGWWYPDDSTTGTRGNCYSFSNRAATGRYEYSDCVCSGACGDCNWFAVCSDAYCCCSCASGGCSHCHTWNERHLKCSDCDGCDGACNRRLCRNKNQIYETTHISCGYSNLNGDRRYNDERGIFWKNLRGNDCGIRQTTMKIRTT